MDATNLIWFDNENPDEIRSEFILLCAKHKNTFEAYEVAQYVFKNLRDPATRAFAAAQVWDNDLGVQEQIRQLILIGDNDVQTTDISLKRRLLAIADDTKTPVKERIYAIETIAKMQGMITKPIEFKDPNITLRKLTPKFVFNIDPDADKPAQDEDDV
jgi:hypothetical protein